MFDQLVASVGGDVRIDPVKTAINLGALVHFAEVWVQAKALRIGFALGRELSSPRVKKIVTTPGMYLYQVRVGQLSEIDPELTEWLREAFRFKGGVISSGSA
jgi:hypothetical protein